VEQSRAKSAQNSQRTEVVPKSYSEDDANYNFRIDKGSHIDGKPELIIQANKNAADNKVKEAGQKDSHAILAKGTVDPKTDTDGRQVRAMLENDFKARK